MLYWDTCYVYANRMVIYWINNTAHFFCKVGVRPGVGSLRNIIPGGVKNRHLTWKLFKCIVSLYFPFCFPARHVPFQYLVVHSQSALLWRIIKKQRHVWSSEAVYTVEILPPFNWGSVLVTLHGNTKSFGLETSIGGTDLIKIFSKQRKYLHIKKWYNSRFASLEWFCSTEGFWLNV